MIRLACVLFVVGCAASHPHARSSHLQRLEALADGTCQHFEIYYDKEAQESFGLPAYRCASEPEDDPWLVCARLQGDRQFCSEITS